jgi:hypothetical protein
MDESDPEFADFDLLQYWQVSEVLNILSFFSDCH